MRHHFIYILFLLCIAKESNSQICPDDPRGIVQLPISAPDGFFANFQVFVPGATIEDKADTCLAALREQFSDEFNAIDFQRQEKVTTSLYNLIEYRQYVDNILVDGHGLWMEFNNSGQLSAIHLYFEYDEGILDNLELLAAGGIPGKHIIKLVNGVFILHQLESP